MSRTPSVGPLERGGGTQGRLDRRASESLTPGRIRAQDHRCDARASSPAGPPVGRAPAGLRGGVRPGACGRPRRAAQAGRRPARALLPACPEHRGHRDGMGALLRPGHAAARPAAAARVRAARRLGLRGRRRRAVGAGHARDSVGERPPPRSRGPAWSPKRRATTRYRCCCPPGRPSSTSGCATWRSSPGVPSRDCPSRRPTCGRSAPAQRSPAGAPLLPARGSCPARRGGRGAVRGGGRDATGAGRRPSASGRGR